jgi:pimeloyl-ACP methyl ester carboxylesterase
VLVKRVIPQRYGPRVSSRRAGRARRRPEPDHDHRLPASYSGIAAFAGTDVTEDLETIDVPALILPGDDDQIAPVANGPHRW